ncbi:MAG TPA: hypothetical protein VK034_31255 [Enhygromyxa sp.]|nr:hypothetical protein [Enhygromyxa sp.]
MQLLAIALAASLVIGPAPVDAVEPTPLPDVDAPADGEVEPEVEPEPEPEVEPEPEPEPVPAPSLTDSEQEEALPTAVVSDKLGCDGSKPCRRMTVAGIVIGTLGLAAVGTGIGLLVKRDEVLPAAPTYVTSTRPAGLVALTIGAGVSLTAVLMLVAAHRGYKQRGAQARVAPLINGLRF